MASCCDKDLSECLYNYAIKVMKVSNQYTTKEAVLRKVLMKCADILEFDLNSFTTKNMIYVHPDNLQRFDAKWQAFMEQGIKLSHEELNTYKLIKSSEYVNILDAQKFINILANRNETVFLNEILAVDNFDSGEFKNYILNLKYGDTGSSHIQIIKDIYRKFAAPVNVVYFALLQIYKKFINEKEVLDMVMDELNKLDSKVDKLLVEDIANMYEISVTNVREIAQMKLLQFKNQLQKLKAPKRNLRGQTKRIKR